MNKKGTHVLHVSIAIITLMGFLLAFFLYTSTVPPEPIGAATSLLFETYHQAQFDLQHVEEAAFVSGKEAVYEQARKGGFVASACGTYYGKQLYSNKNPEQDFANCAPNLKEGFVHYFTPLLEERLSDQYKKSFFSYYVSDLSPLHVEGIGKKHVEAKIKEEGVYAYTPAFSVGLPYTYARYDLIADFIEHLHKECARKENTRIASALDRCVEEATQDFAEEHEVALVPVEKFDGTDFLNTAVQELAKVKTTSCVVDFGTIPTSTGEHDLTSKQGLGVLRNFDPALGIPIEPRKQVRYDFEKKEIRTGDGAERLTQLRMINVGKSYASIVVDGVALGLSGEKRCAYEPRKYVFQLTDEAFLPLQDDVQYDFAVTIQDEVVPEIPALVVQPKEFSEGTLLVQWSVPLSQDVERYTVLVDGKQKKEILLWDGIIVLPSLTFGEGTAPFTHCQLVQETDFTCVYPTGSGTTALEKEQVYYVADQQRFVYVLSGLKDEQKYDITVVAHDDYKQTFSLKQRAAPKDTLPYAALGKADALVVPFQAQLGSFGAVLITVVQPSLKNMDGSAASPSLSYRVFHGQLVDEVLVKEGIAPFYGGLFPITDDPLAQLESTHILIVPEDPAIRNLGILALDLMGYSAGIHDVGAGSSPLDVGEVLA